MNKGLALIALVLSVVALLVTSRQLWGGHDANQSRRVDPIDQLRKLDDSLNELGKQANAASVQLQRIDSRLQALETVQSPEEDAVELLGELLGQAWIA